MKLLLLASALALSACGPGLPCEGPSDCGGNACCYVSFTESGQTTPYVQCTKAPTDCASPDSAYERDRRMCRTDDDCVAGGVNTPFTKCCPASVQSTGSHTCTSPSLCKI